MMSPQGEHAKLVASIRRGVHVEATWEVFEGHECVANWDIDIGKHSDGTTSLVLSRDPMRDGDEPLCIGFTIRTSEIIGMAKMLRHVGGSLFDGPTPEGDVSL